MGAVDLTFASIFPRVSVANVKSKTAPNQYLVVSLWFQHSQKSQPQGRANVGTGTLLLALGQSLALLLVAIADQVERPGRKALRPAPMHQRVLLAVGDPDLIGAGRGNGRSQPVPVGVVRNHQWQFDAPLPRPRTHPHPARGECGYRIGEAPRPDVRGRRRRRQRDGAGEISLLHAAHRLELAERDAAALVVMRDLL